MIPHLKIKIRSSVSRLQTTKSSTHSQQKTSSVSRLETLPFHRRHHLNNNFSNNNFNINNNSPLKPSKTRHMKEEDLNIWRQESRIERNARLLFHVSMSFSQRRLAQPLKWKKTPKENKCSQSREIFPDFEAVSGILSENQENDWENMPLDLKLEIIPKKEIEDDEQIESPKSDQGFVELEEDDSFQLEINEEVEKAESTSTPADDIVLIDEYSDSEFWAHSLTEKIVDSKECVIKCMAPQCKLLLEEGNVHEFISDQGVIICYQRLLVKSYVETNKLLKWCRGVDCENAVKVGYTSIRHVECTCGASFCFSCGNESHEPVNCLLMNFWQKREDKGSLHWMLINTKNCPKCSAPIEKNGGCQHMTCKSCRYEFRWMCSGNWNPDVNCNVYTQNVEQAREQSLNDFNRYTFYQSRYVGHQESLRLEKYLCAQVDAKMKELQDISFFTKGEVYFLKIAVNALHASRRTLMHSYVFGYYLEQNHSAAIFESNQQDLQKATEELSEILESMDFEDLETLKLKICHKYVYVEERRKKLLDHCAEGEDEDNWVFSQ